MDNNTDQELPMVFIIDGKPIMPAAMRIEEIFQQGKRVSRRLVYRSAITLDGTMPPTITKEIVSDSMTIERYGNDRFMAQVYRFVTSEEAADA